MAGNMLNQYMDLKRIEFVVTNACTSRCKHCSFGDTLNKQPQHIDKDAATAAVSALADAYDIGSVMTFGGEPLLFPDIVCAIHQTASEKGIPQRQVITNGYFTRDHEKILAVAKALKQSGVNSLLLSIDAFHREHIPLDRVYPFAKALKDENISGFSLHPAWVVERQHVNRYNAQTEECLDYFADLQIPVSNGNDISPSGNAVVYLSEFYPKEPLDSGFRCGEAPYTVKLDNVRTIAINPNGDVIVCCFVIGNLYQNSIVDIVKAYDPFRNPLMVTLMQDGITGLIQLAEAHGIEVDTASFYSECDLCQYIVKTLM